ncbi:transposase [Novosphingobium mangrovi (ex Huang et al. 2023)]|uniref:Transposase n=1 Tax=Novosphingobium mangrovi (ex Huang et al. 2023) TaxID=2976432 RepID=A0ABT2I0H5_9SPHN|nr:transposase [Novosphingobium mangrovi (ex Huang et al. 2023)]MCT2398299.1 transposase [Novosphingobium mangrovi (ex Huang et al. 2023)]
MATVIAVRDPTPASLEECVEALVTWGFDPGEEESLSHAANWLKRLGNDPHFLGDALVDMMAGLGGDAMDLPATQGAGINHIVLVPPERGNFTISAHIWPSLADHALRASAPEALGYGIVRDHNYDFLDLGYFGPGCEIDDYECDPETMAGWQGEPVMLTPLGRSRMETGSIVHYRAGRDFRCLHPPESLSVTLTLSHAHPSHCWRDHYVLERRRGRAGAFRIARVLGHGPSETFLRIAVALGGEEAQDLARRLGTSHPSDRMRIAAWRALASSARDREARDAVWREAEGAGNRVVAMVARRQRS